MIAKDMEARQRYYHGSGEARYQTTGHWRCEGHVVRRRGGSRHERRCLNRVLTPTLTEGVQHWQCQAHSKPKVLYMPSYREIEVHDD